jgi:exodeoxyribonuclease VII large subunit
MVIAATDEFCARIDRLHGRLRAAAQSRVQRFSRRVHMLAGRPAVAGYPGRVAMRGRYAAELTHALTRGVRAQIAQRDRRVQALRRQLDVYDLGRRLAGIRTRLVGADGRLVAAIARRRHRADSQLRGAAGRLESLSPLAVLARGYAVCWTADRTAVVRDASAITAGEHVRVTLAKGELACEVRGTSTTEATKDSTHADTNRRTR